MYEALSFLAAAASLFSSAFLAFSLMRVLAFRRRLAQPASGGIEAPVTLLKPLYRCDWEVAENLRSFLRQDYGTYQIVFGVRDADDPALAVIAALRAEFPERDIAIMVSNRTWGPNPKVSNLTNMMAEAKHDILIISDSDMRVAPNYIRAVVGPLRDPDVGVTTCLYYGNAQGGTASKLGAMFINDWFFPSSLVALAFEDLDFCFGASIAVRRDVLRAIGGFPVLASFIADDYMLGRMAVAAGYKVALAPYVMENIVHEGTFNSLFSHELRWARTMRSVQPVGYASSAITEAFFLSLLAAAATLASGGSAWIALAYPTVALTLRFLLHHAVWASRPGGGTYSPWLIPIRDLLNVMVRICSLFGKTVTWRDQVLVIGRNSVSPNPIGGSAAHRELS
jgi:ceramide glucosyltransferase